MCFVLVQLQLEDKAFNLHVKCYLSLWTINKSIIFLELTKISSADTLPEPH